MPRVDRQNIDALNLSLVVTIEKDELKKKYNSEISRYQKKAAIKGFRTGKTPEMVIKKMFGSSLFQEAINDFMQTSVMNFIQENKLTILGQPIPAEDTPRNESVSHNKIDDLIFKFDVGLVSDFEVKGVSKSDTYTKVLPEIPQDWIDNAYESDLARNGERSPVEDAIQLKDTFKLSVKEVGGTHTGDFTVLCEMLTEDMQEVFQKHKSGDKLQINLFDLEKDSTPERVRMYFLGMEKENTEEVGEMFDATITEVTRLVPVVADAEYFEKSYGAGVSSEAEAKDFIKQEYYKYMENDAFGLMVRDLQKELIEKNSDIALPDAFLKRWLLFINPKNTPELVEAEYAAFSKNLRWDLTRDAINAQFGIEVTEADIQAVFADKVRSMYSGQGFDESLVAMLAAHVMSDVKSKNKKEYDEAVDNARFVKFFNVIAQNVTVEEKYVPMDEFQAIRNAAFAAVEVERSTSSKLEENIAEVEMLEA